MFVYCEKCGLITSKKATNCIVCETEMKNVPDDYLTSSGFMFKSAEKRKEFEQLIEQNENYNSEIASNKETIIKQKEDRHKADTEKKIEIYNQTRAKILCPVCKSENLDKISNVGKIVKVGALGILGAGDLGKTYRCKSCGYKF